MPSLPRLVVDFSGADQAIRGAVARARDLSPVMRKGPAILRFGQGSLSQQIGQRTQITTTGAQNRWREAPYAVGRPAGPRAAELERVLWDAALATGQGSITRVTSNGFVVAVDDNAVRRAAAARGNRVVSRESYFGFVTARWGSHSGDRRARWTKPTNPRGRVRGNGRPLPPEARKNITSYTARIAAWWFIGSTFGRWLSEAELKSGLLIPPKPLGWSKPVLDRIRAEVIAHVIGRDVLARGRANDPRRAAA